jgi:hypothetical protein
VQDKQLVKLLEHDFSHPRFDVKEQKDFTWLQSEFENEKSFDPAQFNYVLMHANAFIEYLKEQKRVSHGN